MTHDPPTDASGGAQGARSRGSRIVALALLCALGFALGAILFAFSMVGPSRVQRSALTPDPNMDALRIPEFALVDQDGRPFTRADLEGRVTVIDFLFTNCPFVCPALSRQMARLQGMIEGTGAHLVSISVDPERDTPERLREYAAKIGADTRTWSFLTGDFETVRRISEDGLLLALTLDVANKITLGDGTVIDNVAHTSKFILVGPDARVLGVYGGTEADEVDRLARRIRDAFSRR